MFEQSLQLVLDFPMNDLKSNEIYSSMQQKGEQFFTYSTQTKNLSFFWFQLKFMPFYIKFS